MKSIRNSLGKHFQYIKHKFLPNDLENDPNSADNIIIQNQIEEDNIGYRDIVFPQDKKLTVIHYIGQLGPGGAERQLCNTAIRLHEIGLNVTVLTASTPEGELGHYLPLLIGAGVPVRAAQPSNMDQLLKNLPRNQQLKVAALKAVPEFLSSYVYAIVNELLSIKPDILHCWLDYPNIIGGLGGLIAGVPRILIGGRNFNPTNFIFSQPWFEKWYRILLKSRRVVMLNNSVAGAKDYARWLKVPHSAFRVVYNGLDFGQFETVTHKDVLNFRRSLGVTDCTHLVGGIFRLGPEKRPMDFISVIKRVKQDIGNLKVVVVGIGVLENDIKQAIKQNGLEDTISLLGKRTDVFTVIKACDLLLHTAELEGNPNVLLEAQYLGVPVVATKGGGTPEVVEAGVTGLLDPVGDIEALSKSVIRILCDKPFGRALGEEGNKFIKKHFTVDRMVNDYLQIYYTNSRERNCRNHTGFFKS